MPDTTDLNAFNVSLNKIFHSFIIFFQYPSIIFIMVIPNNLIISLCEFVDENGWDQNYFADFNIPRPVTTQWLEPILGNKNPPFHWLD